MTLASQCSVSGVCQFPSMRVSLIAHILSICKAVVTANSPGLNVLQIVIITTSFENELTSANHFVESQCFSADFIHLVPQHPMGYLVYHASEGCPYVQVCKGSNEDNHYHRHGEYDIV